MTTQPFAVWLGTPLLALTALQISAPALGQTTSINFAALGDIGNTAGSAAVANYIRNQGAQFIVTLGDNCYGKQPLAAQLDVNYAAEIGAGKLYPSLGNHEYDDACGGGSLAIGYRDYFKLPNNERYYDFVRGPVHFFALNSYKEPDGTTANSKQGRWLKNKLAASTSPWQVVFFHHPPYSSGSHQSSTYMRWPFEHWGVDAVLTGHDHDYERVLQDANSDGVKLPYFVSGMGGKSRRGFSTIVAGSDKRYSAAEGALFVTASPTSLDFSFRNTSNTVIDTYSIKKASPRPRR